MTKYKLTITCFLVFTLPLAIYFIGNFYWWLWGNVDPNPEKMVASLLGLMVFIPLNIMLYTDVEG